jgi:hypothetical protein
MKIWHEYKTFVSQFLPEKLRPILFNKKFETFIIIYLGVAAICTVAALAMFELV